MKTLYELAFNATLKNMELLVWKCNLLPKKILFALVCACLEDSPKVLAFVNLFKNWPLTEFSVREIGIRLKDEDVLLIASLIQKKQYGCIKLLNLLDIKFGVLSDRATNAILNALLDSESVLSLKNYLSPNSQQTSRSFSDALLYAQKSLFSPPKKASQTQNNCPPVCNNLVIVMEFVINTMNIGKYISLVQMQQNKKMSVSVIVSRLQFVYTSTTDIIKTLKVTNIKELIGVDISFICLCSSADRMKSVCNELKAFKNLEMLNVAYNNITEGQLLTELLSNLQSLHYIDFSGNLLKSGINNILEFGIQTVYLRTLILTGCSITIDCLHALVHSKKITNLGKLKLDQNPILSSCIHLLADLLQKFKHSLTYLDISECHICKESVIELCSVISCITYLEVLILWPNPGINQTSVTQDILPLLTMIPNVRLLPCQS